MKFCGLFKFNIFNTAANIIVDSTLIPKSLLPVNFIALVRFEPLTSSLCSLVMLANYLFACNLLVVPSSYLV